MGALDGRVIIVTGAGRGIGRAHCLEIARHGATVVVNDVGLGADEVAGEIAAAGGSAVADRTSVVDFDGVGALVARIAGTYGRLDGVVNNAGILRDAMVTNMTEEAWDEVVAVHLKGTFNLLKHACDHWRERAKAGEKVRGRVVNTTSGTGLFGNAGQANYGAAKAGIANLTLIAAMEVDRYGVTVNAISPVARTQMTEALPVMRATADAEGWDRYDPANSSPLVAWLLSDGSGWLTGAVLRVDGGLVVRVRPWSLDDAICYTAGSGEGLDFAELDRGMRLAFGTMPGGLATTR